MGLMQPYYSDARVTVYAGDCLDVLRELDDASVDAVCCDPPYGLSEHRRADIEAALLAWLTGDRTMVPTGRGGFMGREWDRFVPPPAVWDECFRVLKPGGHLLAFAGSRTFDLMGISIRLAGLTEGISPEVRDSIAWLYGSGFPKSLDVSKAIDKRRDWTALPKLQAKVREARKTLGISQSEAARRVGLIGPDESLGGGGFMWFETGMRVPTREQYPNLKAVLLLDDECDQAFEEAEREITGTVDEWQNRTNYALTSRDGFRRDTPATDDARTWQGWGTALKPAFEPVVCARKPFSAVPLGSEVNRLHHLIGALLWLSLSPVKRAELSSPSSQVEQPRAWCASARASAATTTSPDASDATATFSSPALASTFSNIVSSWSGILAALSDPTSTSTISTRSSTTTDLRTLNSLLAPLTSQTTMPACECLLSGSPSSAPSAASASTDEWSKWLHTLNASVPEGAIDGIALVVASALARSAESLSADLAAASSAAPTVTTGAASRNGSPAFEPIVVARKPLTGTVASNVLAHGTGALNIDATRIEATDSQLAEKYASVQNAGHRENTVYGADNRDRAGAAPHAAGRWPANVVLDESQAAALDAMSGEQRDGVAVNRNRDGDDMASWYGTRNSQTGPDVGYGGTGGASRYFYTAKAPGTERVKLNGTAHPTVKPLDLMRWLVRLVTPPGGLVLDPFAGSGTTVEACILEGFRCIAIEREPDYLPLIMQRVNRRIDPVAAVKATAEDGGLFDLLGEETA